MKEFILGNFYEFNTIEELNNTKNELLKDAASIEINKNTFLNEWYTDESDTKKVLYLLWKHTIKYMEEIKGKDLYLFDAQEIIDIVVSTPTVSQVRKEMILTFIRNYCNWAVSKELIMNNPADGIDKDEIVKINPKVLQKKIMGLKEFYSLMEHMIEYTYVSNVIPLVLARYGIVGNNLRYMSNLKWDDVNYALEEVFIYNEDRTKIETTIKVDKEFLQWIDKVKYEVAKQKMNEEDIFIDKGYVIKVSNRTKGEDQETVSKETLYTRINTAFKESKIKRLQLGMLEKSRKIEFLLEKRKWRKLTTKDVQEVVLIFNPMASNGAYNALKNDYETLTGDKVLRAITKEFLLADQDSLSFVEKVKEDLEL